MSSKFEITQKSLEIAHSKLEFHFKKTSLGSNERILELKSHLDTTTAFEILLLDICQCWWLLSIARILKFSIVMWFRSRDLIGHLNRQIKLTVEKVSDLTFKKFRVCNFFWNTSFWIFFKLIFWAVKRNLKWSAFSRWSFGPNSTQGSKETIRKTHPTLDFKESR